MHLNVVLCFGIGTIVQTRVEQSYDRYHEAFRPTRPESTSSRYASWSVTCTFDGPVRLVFDAWTKPELFKLLWWAPKSCGVPLFSCEMVVRIGGSYRIAFGDDPSNAMAFFGKYLEVSSPSRLVWTNDESDEGAVTTVTFEKDNDRTLLVSSIPRRKRSTRRSLAWRIRCLNNSRSWMSFSSRVAQAPESAVQNRPKRATGTAFTNPRSEAA
ncbi:uncharacterized protein YndB with AHSA1/START domain [Rhizobium sp. BK661]|nr:uncharacterized protein YndB with AHSA1/START domain [Rhizobium sp. BK661]